MSKEEIKNKKTVVLIVFDGHWFLETMTISLRPLNLNTEFIGDYSESLVKRFKHLKGDCAIIYYHSSFADPSLQRLGEQSDELVRHCKENNIPVGTLYSMTGKDIYPRVKGDLFDEPISLGTNLGFFILKSLKNWLNSDG